MQEMEEDMEIEHFFVAHEIDLDYEFDAARFFDFTRPETPAEAHQAEIWFETAGSYPPSPFVAKLVMGEDVLIESATASPKSKHLEYTSLMDDSKVSVPSAMEYSETDIDNKADVKAGGNISGLLSGILQNVAKEPLQVTTGFTFYGESKITWDSMNSKARSAVSKRSTLMKPTASQLAKQNRPPQTVGSRYHKLPGLNNERTVSIASGVESQAAKRQKLDCGLLRKVADVKQQTNFFHKAPKTVVTVEQNAAPARLKLTIPLEPELETAQRAQRIRPKNAAMTEHVTEAVHRFKARPLNRKILEAPSLPLPKRSTPRLPEFQEFHLKTSERAIHHTSASSSASLQCNNFDKGMDKPNTVSARENRIKDIRRYFRVKEILVFSGTASRKPQCQWILIFIRRREFNRTLRLISSARKSTPYLVEGKTNVEITTAAAKLVQCLVPGGAWASDENKQKQCKTSFSYGDQIRIFAVDMEVR
ncbi:protein TPX2 isoform X2 [Neltuma alba]|uniref:protein TPX2 isoform X2 n=1 Tax=Neltuma alba TaxID=207710 RepID=UPI0010A3B369|nr:protein TPX2-like isoform X2 [Prosopis alba]